MEVTTLPEANASVLDVALYVVVALPTPTSILMLSYDCSSASLVCPLDLTRSNLTQLAAQLALVYVSDSAA